MAYESDADEREQDEDMEVDEAYDVRFCPSSRTDVHHGPQGAFDVESEDLTPPPSVAKPRLKIKLKLPQILSPNEPSSRAASTPSGSQPPSRRGVSKGAAVIVSMSIAHYGFRRIY